MRAHYGRRTTAASSTRITTLTPTGSAGSSYAPPTATATPPFAPTLLRTTPTEAIRPTLPDQVCYLVVRKPGVETDAAEPDQVVFPREREIQRTLAPTPTANPTLAPTPTPQVAPDSPPELSSLELDGEVINSRDIVRSGLSRSQEVRIALQVSDADGGLAYLALVAQGRHRA